MSTIEIIIFINYGLSELKNSIIEMQAIKTHAYQNHGWKGILPQIQLHC
jgi:hypothetical protein